MVIEVGIGTVIVWGNVIAGSRVVIEGPGTNVIGETGVRAGKQATGAGIIGVGLGGRIGVKSWVVKTRYVGGGT